jgi:segregation and condensation protein A
MMPSWTILQQFLPEDLSHEQILQVKSAVASTFAASLEMVKNGELEIRQDGTCAPIYLRRRETTPESSVTEQIVSE